MPPPFRILPTSRFQRDAAKLLTGNPGLTRVFERLNTILKQDPSNQTRQHPIKKLSDVSPGEGQWRIRAGDYRLRYDIVGNDVVLYSFRHRKEAY
ncbi:MAG: type II toxin-antitoxin system RelE/ParE family toxin [Chloroflexi bacterium]|nr:type II toxin-antitoxin system RelE/ParE family toxin [Chloroflexota bacterium]